MNFLGPNNQLTKQYSEIFAESSTTNK